ncbi:hypothetical protein ACN28S_22500 [Cystobacter fuscus]
MEVLEQARDQQAELLKTLQSHGWRRRLRERPALPRQWREQEATLGEAIMRAERRLQTESSPGRHPLQLLLRQLHEQRARLETRVHERLVQLGLQYVSLAKGLERLEAEFRPWPPGKEELVLLSAGHDGVILLMIFAMWAVLLFGALMCSDLIPLWYSLPLCSILPFVMLLGYTRNTRRYWITRHRLVWERYVGGLQQLPLESIQADRITWTVSPSSPDSLPEQFYLKVDARGGRRVTFTNLEHLDRLEALLREHCKPPVADGR